MDRSVLPITVPARPEVTELDVRKATPPPQFAVKAPKDAPNVLLILVDDLGFAGTSTFGGPVSTPNFQQIANEGVYYNNFHTTAVCSATRAAIKSGRNHHVNNMAGIIETRTAFSGNTGEIPGDVAPVAEMLRLNGYSTAAFGKWHETATWEASVSGPMDRWPTHQGFDKFYGFLGGETNQWAPYIYDGNHVVEIPEDPDYHFLEDMTNQAVSWIKYQKALTPDIWALYVKDGVLAYDYNFLGLNSTTIAANKPLKAGTVNVRFEFDYDGGGPGRGGKGTLFVDDKQVDQGRNDRTQPVFFSADEAADVGIDLATPVVERIGAERESGFTGSVNSVTVQVR